MIQFILEGNTAEKYRDSRSVTFNVQGSLFRAVFLEIVIEVQISESHLVKHSNKLSIEIVNVSMGFILYPNVL
jgi:hypothetical protein